MLEWSDMATRRLLFDLVSTIKIQLSVLVYYKVDIIIISLKCNLFLPWYIWKIAHLVLNNNWSLTRSLIHSLDHSSTHSLILYVVNLLMNYYKYETLIVTLLIFSSYVLVYRSLQLKSLYTVSSLVTCCC